MSKRWATKSKGGKAIRGRTGKPIHFLTEGDKSKLSRSVKSVKPSEGRVQKVKIVAAQGFRVCDRFAPEGLSREEIGAPIVSKTRKGMQWEINYAIKEGEITKETAKNLEIIKGRGFDYDDGEWVDGYIVVKKTPMKKKPPAKVINVDIRLYSSLPSKTRAIWDDAVDRILKRDDDESPVVAERLARSAYRKDGVKGLKALGKKSIKKVVKQKETPLGYHKRMYVRYVNLIAKEYKNAPYADGKKISRLSEAGAKHLKYLKEHGSTRVYIVHYVNENGIGNVQVQARTARKAIGLVRKKRPNWKYRGATLLRED